MTPQWAERQLELNDILILDADFATGIKAIRDGLTANTVEDASGLAEALNLILEAAHLSSTFITEKGEGLWFQLYGRLKGREERLVQEYLRSIRSARKPLLFPENDLLSEAGGPNRKIISLGVKVPHRMVFNRECEKTLCGCHDGSIAVVSFHDSILEKEWQAHDENISAIAVGRNGSRIVSGCEGGIAKVWDFENYSCLSVFKCHNDKITAIEVFKDGRRVISSSANGSVQIWEMDSGRIISQPIFIHETWISFVALMGEGNTIVTALRDRPEMWNSAPGDPIGAPLDEHDQGLESMALSPDEQRVVAGSIDGTIPIWDTLSRELIGNLSDGHNGMVCRVAVSKDGSRIASGSIGETICVWDLESMELICPPLKGHTSMVTGVSFLSNSSLIASCSVDRTVRLWDVERSKQEMVSNRRTSAVVAAHFSSNGELLITAGNEGTVCVWDANTGQRVRDPLRAHDGGWIRDVAIAPSGCHAVSTTKDRLIRVWDLNFGELLGSISNPDYDVCALAFTPDGNRVVTGGQDSTVRIWDFEALANGFEDDEVQADECDHMILTRYRDSVKQLFISDDGMRVISVDTGGTIIVWDVDTGQALKEVVWKTTRRMTRREILLHIGETTVLDKSLLSSSEQGYEMLYGEEPNVQTLAKFGAFIVCWDISPDQSTVCVGLSNGQFALMKLVS